MSKKSEENLIVDRVREQIQKIVEEELEQLFQQMKIAEGSTERVKRRIEDLLKNYRDVESLLGNLSTMSLLGLTGENVKTEKIDPNQLYATHINNDRIQIRLSVAGVDMFHTHPTGSLFTLDKREKYHLLVAFIPVEAET